MLRDLTRAIGRRALDAGLDFVPNRLKWELMAYAPAQYVHIVPVESEAELVDSGREEVDAILERLRAYDESFRLQGSSVLEIGTGPGRLLVPIGSRGADVHGVDISRGNLAQARNLAAKHGVDPVLRRSTAGLPEFERSFDLIYSALVFQHMRRRTAIEYMRDAHDQLAADGLVYFTFANLADDECRASYTSEGLEKTYSFRMRYYTESEVRLLLEELDYSDISILDVGPQLVAIARP